MGDCEMLVLFVFIDFDGMFFDYDDYLWCGVSVVVECLCMSGVLFIFVLSKMRLEMEMLCRELGNDYVFVVENGGVIYLLCVVGVEFFGEFFECVVFGVECRVVFEIFVELW